MPEEPSVAARAEKQQTGTSQQRIETIDGLEQVMFPDGDTPSFGFQCTECKCSYGREALLRYHMISVHHIVENAKNKRSLEENQQLTDIAMAQYKKGVCALCGKTFKTSIELRHHLTLVHELKLPQRSRRCNVPDDGKLNFECELCARKYRGRSALRAHLKNFHGMQPPIYVRPIRREASARVLFPCAICNVEFGCKRGLLDHNWRKHDGPEPEFEERKKRFKCHICKKDFVKAFSVKKHLRVVHKIVPEYHAEKFSLNEKRKTAEEVEEERQKKNEERDARLEKRLAKHRDGFKCDVCPARFTNAGSRRNHMTGMHGIAPKKRGNFSLASKAKMGRKSVSGRVKCVCHLCGRPFCNRSGLRNHLMTVHEVERKDVHVMVDDMNKYKCDQCSLSFPKFEYYQTHKAAEHQINIDMRWNDNNGNSSATHTESHASPVVLADPLTDDATPGDRPTEQLHEPKMELDDENETETDDTEIMPQLP